MSSARGILQADGTYCRKGANCKRHGSISTSSGQKVTELQQQISSLLSATKTPKKRLSWFEKKTLVKKPEWATPEREEEVIKEETAYYKQTGLKSSLKIPYWHPTAANYDYLEIECDNKTSLLIDPKNRWNNFGSRRRHTLWLVKEGKTVAMLSYLVSTPDAGERWEEATVGDIETNPEHRGKGYSTEIIRLAENYLLDQKLHSGGHYTPEGEKFLKGKLPYTKQALFDEEQSKKYEFSKGIGVHFNSMSFVDDWKNLRTK